MLNLIEKAKQGDQESFEQLIKKHQKLFKKITYKYYLPGQSREDVYQEACIAFYQALMAYNNQHNTEFSVFAKMVVERKVKSAIRRNNFKKHIALNTAYSLDAQMTETTTYLENLCDCQYDRLIDNIENEKWEDTLEKSNLTEFEKKVFVLCNIYELSYIAVSQQLLCTIKSIDNANQRAKRKLRKQYYQIQ